MLDRHALQELVRAGFTARVIAKQFGVSVRTVRRILREAAVEGSADDALAREARRIGRPRVTAVTRERVRALVEEHTESRWRDLAAPPRGRQASGPEHGVSRARRCEIDDLRRASGTIRRRSG
jgi:IS30 family transposase